MKRVYSHNNSWHLVQTFLNFDRNTNKIKNIFFLGWWWGWWISWIDGEGALNSNVCREGVLLLLWWCVCVGGGGGGVVVVGAVTHPNNFRSQRRIYLFHWSTMTYMGALAFICCIALALAHIDGDGGTHFQCIYYLVPYTDLNSRGSFDV